MERFFDAVWEPALKFPFHTGVEGALETSEGVAFCPSEYKYPGLISPGGVDLIAVPCPAESRLLKGGTSWDAAVSS